MTAALSDARQKFSASLAAARMHLGRLPWQRMDRHRRPVAIAVSIGLHILFALCLLPHTQTGFSTGGQGGVHHGEGEGLSVDLTAIALPDAAGIEVRAVEEETLDATETLDDVTAEADTSTVNDVPPIIAGLSEQTPVQQTTSKSAQASAAREGGEGQDGTSSGTFDELWAAIAPCWRRIADGETLPVNLTVSFAGNGMLAKPPEIMRKAKDASNAQALRSESLAITALAECGAYQMAGGRENVSIHFPKP